ncbi:MAG: T9SS type A sorting domain-containing protein [Bacteroidia bacterium]|nr:T9SS type A sorting domain-containing protein [Bacteroidia bacterium]
MKQNIQLELQPVPTRDYLNFQTNMIIYNTSVFSTTDFLGKTIYGNYLCTTNELIYVRNLPDGIYILKIENSSKIAFKNLSYKNSGSRILSGLDSIVSVNIFMKIKN